MKLHLSAVVIAAGLMTFGHLVTPALADEENKETIFTFDKPVEVPGRVLLPGTYVFKLAYPYSNRDVIQIFKVDDRGRDHILTTLIATPAYRVEAPSEPVITFEERRKTSPEAVHTWFYPGDNDGWEFNYDNVRPHNVASAAQPAGPMSAAQMVAPLPPMLQPMPVGEEDTVIEQSVQYWLQTAHS